MLYVFDFDFAISFLRRWHFRYALLTQYFAMECGVYSLDIRALFMRCDQVVFSRRILRLEFQKHSADS